MNKDYEQLYYDTLYELKELRKKVDILEQENEIYKSIQKNKDLKKVIVDMLIRYTNKDKENKYEC